MDGHDLANAYRAVLCDTIRDLQKELLIANNTINKIDFFFILQLLK